MSTRVVQVCDVPVGNKGGQCGNEATIKVDVKIGRSNYAADVCEDDMPKVEKALGSIGISLKSAKTADSKTRKALKTKKGKDFTAADARPWLIEQGLLAEGTSGRIAGSLMEQYADAH
jgi:hypothetical protein